MLKTKFTAPPGTQEIVMERTFNAPRQRIFKAYTDPSLVAQWWGTASMTTVIDKMDVRKGGQWRWLQRDADGNEYAHNGVYHEIASPERIINTYEFEGLPGNVGLVILTLEEQDGKTKLTEKSVFPSVEVRDATIQSGMTEGSIEVMDRLEMLLAKM
jgi:uncharacterized protein YndB with AHSA1/START domain